MILGIDPGMSGALVIMDDENKIADVLHMPTLVNEKGHKQVDAGAVFDWLSVHEEITEAYIEFVHSMPNQGVASMFSFGKACGLVEGALQSAGMTYRVVRPRDWKAYFSLVGQEKDASRRLAQKRFDHPDLEKKAKGQAIADAAFIALYGRHIHYG